VHGLIGEEPRTSWLINYPLLERIHYLLVAEFDVFRESLQAHVAPALNDQLSLNHPSIPSAHRTALERLAALEGRRLAQFPEVSLLSVRTTDGTLQLYTVLRHVAHANITSLFAENKTLLPDEDTLDVVRGVVGDYPSVFWHVDEAQLDSFVDSASAIDTPADYAVFMRTFGIRRSHESFWAHADCVHDRLATTQPIDGGLLDFNRLENR